MCIPLYAGHPLYCCTWFLRSSFSRSETSTQLTNDAHVRSSYQRGCRCLPVKAVGREISSGIAGCSGVCCCACDDGTTAGPALGGNDGATSAPGQTETSCTCSHDSHTEHDGTAIHCRSDAVWTGTKAPTYCVHLCESSRIP